MPPPRVSRLFSFIASLALLAASRVGAVEMRNISVGGNSRPVTLFAPDGGFSAPAGSLPLVLFLRGFTCALPPSVVNAIGATAQNALELSNADVGIARAAADATRAIYALVDAPRTTRICTACKQVVGYVTSPEAAAQPRQARGNALLGAAVLSAAAKLGVDCPAWDAGAACCNAERSPAGDVPNVLRALNDIKRAVPSADASRVVLAGVSAGGFMALRTACEAPAGTFSSVFSYAGSIGQDELRRCKPPKPLPVVLLHGTNDLEVPFGGSVPGPYPQFVGAEATLALWAGIDACDTSSRTERSVGVRGSAQSTVRVVSFGRGCAVRPVELWSTPWEHAPPVLASDPGRAAATEVFFSAFKRALNQTNAVSNA